MHLPDRPGEAPTCNPVCRCAMQRISTNASRCTATGRCSERQDGTGRGRKVQPRLDALPAVDGGRAGHGALSIGDGQRERTNERERGTRTAPILRDEPVRTARRRGGRPRRAKHATQWPHLPTSIVITQCSVAISPNCSVVDPDVI